MKTINLVVRVTPELWDAIQDACDNPSALVRKLLAEHLGRPDLAAVGHAVEHHSARKNRALVQEGAVQ